MTWSALAGTLKDMLVMQRRLEALEALPAHDQAEHLLEEMQQATARADALEQEVSAAIQAAKGATPPGRIPRKKLNKLLARAQKEMLLLQRLLTALTELEEAEAKHE